jgi:hypothetical protein
MIGERRAGEILRDMEKAKGAATPGTNRGTTPSIDTRASTLADHGITYDQSSNWQKLAAASAMPFPGAAEHAGRD